MKTRFTEDSYRKEPWLRAVSDALLSCKSTEEMMDILRDIATLSELQAWGERLEVAKQLTKGLSYRQVAKNTGASTTTVTRVAKFIENGAGGYRRYLKAHRHHRMMPRQEQLQAPVPIERTEPQQAQPKPAPTSVLQKYLDRR